MATTFVGIHVPKCAGTTLLNRVQAELPRDEVYQSTSLLKNWHNGRPGFLEIERRQNLRFVFGHSVHEEMLKLLEEPVLFTGLREPLARMRSQLRYETRLRATQGRSTADVAEGLSRAQNPMAWFLVNRFPKIAGNDSNAPLLDKAKRVLEACTFVYFAETFESAAAPLFAALGIAPKPVDANISPDDGVALEEITPDLDTDIALYHWAREKFGPMDVTAAIRGGSRVPDWFLKGPLRLPALRKFLYEAQAHEYRNWGVLDEVIARKASALIDLQSELDAYTAARWHNR